MLIHDESCCGLKINPFPAQLFEARREHECMIRIRRCSLRLYRIACCRRLRDREQFFGGHGGQQAVQQQVDSEDDEQGLNAAETD
jgi:hypothetical protein